MFFSTAELCDRYGDALRVADPIFKRYGGKSSFCGPIVTLKVKDDFLLIKQTLSQNAVGSVLVIDGGATTRVALLGDRLAAKAVEKGWSGIVINGCIRDSDAINQLQIGVRAFNTCPRRPSMRGGGQYGIELDFAGVKFVPGGYLYADADGILLSGSELDLNNSESD